ncbi:MAG: exosome complex RNA-binding protein Rrp4 [Candidatus Woesearchaeota archaeon]
MSELNVKERQVVVPGQVLAKGMDYLPSHGTYRLDDKVIANKLGIINIQGKVLKSLPLVGRYIPSRDDVVVGKIIDILMSGWRLEINSPYSAVLPLREGSFDFIQKGADLSKYFALEDYAVVKVTNVTSQNLVDVSAKGPGLRRLKGGRIIHVNSLKVPRIIGKKGSMISIVKNATGCRIIVGQNGIIWLQGEPEGEVLAVKAIKMIEQESHTQGLTQKIMTFLNYDENSNNSNDKGDNNDEKTE